MSGGPGDGWAMADDRWDRRARLIASLIAPGWSVLDLGAGAEGLADRLPPGCRYVPADRVRRSARTLIVDLDRGDPLPAGFDVIVAAGVLEYLERPALLFRVTRPAGRRLLLTYHRPRVRSAGWRHNLTPDELADLARSEGWRGMTRAGAVEGQLVWRFR